MNRNVLIRIDATPPARLWSGAGHLYLPADDVEVEDGALYLGGGELLDGLNDVEQLINGTADRIEINVSGVTPEAVRFAIEEADKIKGADVDIGIAEFDDLWQLVAVTWSARYRADKLTTARQPATRTISLSMGSDDTGRSRAPNAYFTDAYQRRRSPDDAIFSHVSGINAGKSRAFGPT